MSKLNQIIAVEKGIKARVIADLDQLDKAFQKPNLFEGQTKVYQKRNEDEEDVPTVKQNVQVRVPETFRAIQSRLSELLDVTAQKDIANTQAKADVVVEGETIIAGSPATYLLFVEKQLVDLYTLVGRIPTLDPSEVWTLDKTQGVFRTEPTLTSRTKKVQKPLVLYPATDKHPAQAQVIVEDVTVGTYQTSRFSGAIPEGDKKALLQRIDKLAAAVKFAREEANAVDAPATKFGTKIIEWVFSAR